MNKIRLNKVKKLSKKTIIAICSFVSFLLFSVLTDMFEEVIAFKILLLISAIAVGYVVIPKLVKDDNPLVIGVEIDYEDRNKKQEEPSRFGVEDV